MQPITLITGNPDKLREIQAIIPPAINLTHKKLNLEEIQGDADPETILRHKLRQAYEIVKGPVIVEDVSAGIESLNWLPGPFIKYFQDQLGGDALYKLSGDPTTDRVRAQCYIGYKDKDHEITTLGEIYGTLCPPEGEGGFGFDPVFIPEGHSSSLAVMGSEIKNSLSHRKKAAEALVAELRKAGIC